MSSPDAERLAALLEQAEALIAGSRFAMKMRDQASIVRGYVELFATYEPGQFPWEHVEEIVARMRASARCGKWLVPRDPPVPYQWVPFEEPAAEGAAPALSSPPAGDAVETADLIHSPS